MNRTSIAAFVGAVCLAACGGSSTTSSSSTSTTSTSPSPTAPTPTPTAAATLPSWFSAFYGATVSLNGSSVVLTTKDLPDHKSPYWGVGNALYEAPQPGMVPNPSLIVAQNITITVPVSPAVASASDTPLGPMGIAVNGVALFNQYAAGRSPLTSEKVSFDEYNGHPQQQGMYHYHLEPLYLTASSSSRLIGVLADGFAVYGPKDSNGSTPGDLDACNGHVGTTPEFTTARYHYHVTANVPYIAGCYRGTPGTISF